MIKVDPEISLYIHIPWCISKCYYCDFNSYKVTQPLPEEEYFLALLADLKHMKELSNHKILKSIFLGGGTPSLLKCSFINNLLNEINKLFSFTKDIEISLEANPGTIDYNKCLEYKNIGISRISLGVQSFDEKKLSVLGRIHNNKDIFNAIEIIKKCDFKTLNLDLIYDLPDQSPNDALLDLNTAINCQPNHISWYQLTIEPGTLFYVKPPKPNNESILTIIEEEGSNLLESNNFKRYEVSAYAKSNHCCVHNLNYWQYGDYIGIGAGAHSKITKNNQIMRIEKHKDPNKYLDPKQFYIHTTNTLNNSEICLEFMLNYLRLMIPFSQSLFEQQTGIKFSEITHLFHKAIKEELLTIINGQFIATEKGNKYLNDLLAIFVP